MSKTRIPPKVVLELWTRAAGRCEMRSCNKFLFDSVTSPESFNGAEMAHIIANLAKGPRGVEKESAKLAKDVNNLMLLCPSCHNEIDKSENLEYFTIELLTNMKKEHEDRIRLVTGITEDQDCHVITYYAGISDIDNFFTEKRIKSELLPDYFTHFPHINLGMSGRYDKDNTEKYWIDEENNLVNNFNKKVRPIIEENEVNSFAVFALAPIPLLIKLGALLDDKVSSAVYQKHRNPDTWKWLEEDIRDFDYKIIYPEKISNNIALNLSLSGTITDDRIQAVFPDKDIDICTLTIKNPNFDYLMTKEQLEIFSVKINQILDRLKEMYGHNNNLHVFPACPSSIAIEIGRRWFKKADLNLVIYDENRSKGGFIKAMEITSEYHK
ncbi:MAG: SAVED domain-containing protein [Gudongella sp.]|nr:SAVED domain-containing protein [Gudongella sp.]